MGFDNLPGVFDIRSDGNLTVTPINENPIIVVLGTAAQGDSNTLFVVNRVTDASKAYGRDGTLVRGMYEVAQAGGLNLRLFRIGATTATLATVGGTPGITIETVRADNDAGLAYKLFWDDAAGRLRVYRASDDELIYDNNPTYPSLAIDLGEVSVSGTTGGGTPADIGTLATPITLAAANAVGGAAYTAGTDGVLLSRMALWERLYDAYQLLENQSLDFVVPMDVYVNDLNVMDMTTATITSLDLASLVAFPTAGAADDVLGKIFVQEYQGKNYYWWDTDRDNVAEIFPTVGSSTSTTDAFGNGLTGADFHEANFAYQLARFCFTQSQDSTEMVGFIGTVPPVSLGLKDVSNWVGLAPITALDSSGNRVITTNGNGLLGMKWHAGRLGSAGSGLPDHTIDGISGLSGGGYIATDSEFPDGAQEKDRNNRLVDIGKYINVVPAYAILANPSQTTAYVASGAAAYAGFASSLPANSAPTNKVIPAARLPFRIGNSKLDDLAGLGYVMFSAKPKGVVVSDAPTAARQVSDYRRLTTMRIVKATIDAIRSVADPFLGEAITGARLAALETAIDSALNKLQKAQFLQRYDFTVVSTPSQQVQGKATVELKLVPAFELRQITVNVALAAS